MNNEGPIIFPDLPERHPGRVPGHELEAALRVLDALAAEKPDARVEAVHEHRPEEGALGDRVLLQVRARPAHQALAAALHLVQALLKLFHVRELGGAVGVGEQQALAPEGESSD